MLILGVTRDAPRTLVIVCRHPDVVSGNGLRELTRIGPFSRLPYRGSLRLSGYPCGQKTEVAETFAAKALGPKQLMAVCGPPRLILLAQTACRSVSKGKRCLKSSAGLLGRILSCRRGRCRMPISPSDASAPKKEKWVELFPPDSLQWTPPIALALCQSLPVRGISGDALWRGMPCTA